MRIPCSSDGASCSTPDTVAANCTMYWYAAIHTIPAHVRRYTKTFYYSKDIEVINFFVKICHYRGDTLQIYTGSTDISAGKNPDSMVHQGIYRK